MAGVTGRCPGKRTKLAILRVRSPDYCGKLSLIFRKLNAANSGPLTRLNGRSRLLTLRESDEENEIDDPESEQVTANHFVEDDDNDAAELVTPEQHRSVDRRVITIDTPSIYSHFTLLYIV